MDNNQYAIIAGALLSLAGFYLPWFNTWYKKLTAGNKQLVMLGLIFVAVAGRFGLACIGKDIAFVCDANGAYEALSAFVMTVVANAGVYKGVNYLATKK